MTTYSVAINITAATTVTCTPTVVDTLSNRDDLEVSGSIDLSLVGTTVEPGEPNAAGYTGTLWFEVPLDPDDTTQERVTLTSPTSTGSVSVYKQPSLDDETDEDDLDEGSSFAGEPNFDDLVLVQAASSDQVFTLDQDYGSSYFFQVGLLTGTGDDFTLSWGDAEPDAGGTFEGALDNTGIVGFDTVNTENAWLETGEPSSSGVTETRSVWVAWTAPSTVDEDTIFTVSGGGSSPFGTEVYTGSASNIASLSAVASATSTDGSPVSMQITPTADTTYFIRVATAVDGVEFQVAWSVPKGEYASVEPISNLRVTVHAGVRGGTWAGRSYDANELITEIPNRLNCQFQESLNIPGSGSISMLQDDPILRAFGPDDWPFDQDGSWSAATQNTWSEDPFQLLQFGNIVKFWMFNSATNTSECVSAFIIKARDVNVVGANENADRTITVSGPTVHQLLADFMVVHDNYPDTRNVENRPFNWASIAGPSDNWAVGGWLDRSGTFSSNKRAWNNPINTSAFKNPPGWVKHRNQAAKNRPKYALVRAKKPAWPDKNARWMWMNQNRNQNQNDSFPPKGKKTDGLHYYRSKSFNITSGGKRYRFSAYSDTYYEIWLDGKIFMRGNGNENYRKFKHKVTTLQKTTDKRQHTIAIYVEDRRRKGKDYDHNDAFLFTVQQLNSKGKVRKTILRSNAGSWMAWHGENPPAWSRAMVLATVVREAKERGNDSALALTLRSDFGQKSEEGNYWWDEKKESMAIQVGTSVLDLQAQFSESNRFDVWVDPDTLELYAWQGSNNGLVPRGADRTNNVALVPGYNLINWTVTEVDQIKNSLLVKYAGGYLYAEADSDAANYETMKKYGRREGYLELGGLHTKYAAEARAKSLLTWLASPEISGGSDDIVGHLNEAYNGSVIPVRGAVPFLDWNVGDTISSPASNGLLRPHRVLSLTCTEDQDNKLTFDPELQGI